MTLFLASIAILSNQEIDLSRKVSFESRAARVEMLLPELSKATGTNFMFSPQTKDEVLVIKVSDVALRQLMEGVAEAAAAEWQKEADGYRLIRSPKLLRKLEEESAALELKHIETGKEILRKSLENVPQYTDAMAQGVAEQLLNYIKQQSEEERAEPDFLRAAALRPTLPGYRLASRIALTLDPKVLVKLPKNRRVAFSNLPNRIQIALPAKIDPHLAEYRESVRRLANHLPAEPKMPEGGVESNVWNAINLGKHAAEVPSKVIMKTTRTSQRGYFSFEFLVASDKGRILDRAYLNLYPRDQSSLRGPSPEPPPSDPNEKPVEFSPLSKEFVKRIIFDPDRLARPVMSDELRQFLLNPERNEPGALAYSDMLFSLAAQRDLDLVATQTPENNYYFAIFGSEASAKPSDWLRRVEQSWSTGIRPSRKGNWLVLSPDDWFGKHELIHDRTALGRFIRQAHRQPPTLDDLASYAVQSKSREVYEVAAALLQILGSSEQDEPAAYDFELLQLHGSLTPTQRRQGLSDKGVAFASLTPAQQAHLQNCILGNQGFYCTIEFGDRKGMPAEEEINPYDSIANDPFEAYGNGIPGSGILKITYGNNPVVRATEMRGGDFYAFADLDTSSLAHFLMARESGEQTGNPNYGSFTAFEQEKYEYSFLAVRPLVHGGQLARYRGSSATVDSVDKLPKSILDHVMAEVKKLKDARSGVRPPT